MIGMRAAFLGAALALLCGQLTQALLARPPTSPSAASVLRFGRQSALRVKSGEDFLAMSKLNITMDDLPPVMPYQDRKDLWAKIHKLEAKLGAAVNQESFELAAELREEAEELRSKDRYTVLESYFESAIAEKEIELARSIQQLMIEAGAPPEQVVFKRPWGGGKKRLTRQRDDEDEFMSDRGLAGAGSGPLGSRGRGSGRVRPVRSGNRGRSNLPEELKAGVKAVSTSECTTEGVSVEVKSFYSPQQSKPGQNEFMFLYRVTISNVGDRTVRLLHRKWEIESASGSKEVAQGPGVIGQQPVLEPGQSFEYTSAVPLRAKAVEQDGVDVVGRMSGAYVMRAEEADDPFEVRIAPFYLMLAEGEEDGDDGGAE